MTIVFLIGRILFSLIFIIKGIEHFLPRMINYAVEMCVPLPYISVPIMGVIALIGGLSVLLGYKAKIGAWFLVAFLLLVTFFVHRFWEPGKFTEVMLHELCFLKNISLLGAALMVAYAGSGPLGIDKPRCPHKHDHDSDHDQNPSSDQK
ncbi:DoxX family protein [Candidatus Aerophobetes bacterium]|uniref:DoxX family protein n=1 Tax=Aerophobetes bacterium TaxID=2030807 RepID=A0A2A4YBV9_UNCAE|nr:MAG: DoxX family protein [Candidatus Aerophobetes bacterium]